MLTSRVAGFKYCYQYSFANMTYLVDVRLGTRDSGKSLFDHIRNLGQNVYLFDQTILSCGGTHLFNDELCRCSTLAITSVTGPVDLHSGGSFVPSERVLDSSQVSSDRDIIARLGQCLGIGGSTGDMGLTDSNDRYRIFRRNIKCADVDLCATRVGAAGSIGVLKLAQRGMRRTVVSSSIWIARTRPSLLSSWPPPVVKNAKFHLEASFG